jgi:hypothetical protein
VHAQAALAYARAIVKIGCIKNEFITTHLSDKACKSGCGGKTKQRIENVRKKLSEIGSQKLFLAALSALFCFF